MSVWDEAEKPVSVWDRAEFVPTAFQHLRRRRSEIEEVAKRPGPVKLDGMPKVESAAVPDMLVRKPLEQLSPQEMVKAARAALVEPEPYKRPARLGTLKLKSYQERASVALRQPNSENMLNALLQEAYSVPGPQESRDEAVREIVRAQVSHEAGRVQKALQSNTDRQVWQEEAEALKGKFLSKTYRRWERGSAMTVGGGLHLAEEMTRLVTLGRRGDTLQEWAGMYSDVLNRPEMQPVIENTFDKYWGGGVEMAPFLLTTLLPGGAAKMFGSMPQIAGAIRAMTPAFNFLTAYGIEGNGIYQTSKQQGFSESEARMRGVVGGLVNAGIEIHGGSGDKYWKQEVIEAATTKLGRAKYFTRKTLRTALAEGLAEEMPQEVVSMVLGGDAPRREDGSVDWAKVADRIIDAGLMGTLMGGLVATPITAVEASRMPTWAENQVIPVGTEAVSIPGRTYAEARQRVDSEIGGKNPWIKQESSKTNKDRVLLVQFASDLLTEGKEDPAAKAYYDKLYASRPGYARLGDTWEIPKWITEAAFFVPRADVYFVRDMAEAKQFLKTSGYGKAMMSALDINTPHIRELIKDYGGKAVIGGYVAGKEAFAGLPDAIWYDSMSDMAKGEGYEYKAGVNLGHFEGSQVVPRLCMSKGCKHRCAFCVVSRKFEEMPAELIEQQVDAIASLDAKLIYLDDKTLGQAKNFPLLSDLYWTIKEKNPEFEGFIIQTTAAQFGRFSDEFLTASHVRYAEIGVETYNDDILGELRKPHNTAMIDAAAAKARRLKINLVPNVMIGLPQETAGTYARTVQWLEANKDIISHVNAYNLAVYDNAKLKRMIYGDEGATIPPEDQNENVMVKSFHKDPQIVKAFAEAVYKFSLGVLDKPPVDQTGLSVDQEIAAKYGVEPGRVELLLKQAEDRYRELKAKKTGDRKGQPVHIFKNGNIRPATGEHAELAFLSRHRNDIEVILGDITSPKPVTNLVIPMTVAPTRPVRQLKEMGHGIAQQLGMTEEERRLLAVELTGKNSMKKMDGNEAEQFVQYLEELLRERGEIYEPKQSSYYEMLDILQNRQRSDRIEGAESAKDMIRGLGQDMIRLVWSGTRMDRFFGWLDGGVEGWFKRTFWRPVVKANANYLDAAEQDMHLWNDMVHTLGLKPAEMFRAEKVNDHLELNRWEQMGVVMRHMNEIGKKWDNILGYTDQDVADIYQFWGGSDSPEAKLMDYMFEWYQNFWPAIRRTAISVGIDEKTLKQEFLYSPIMAKGINLEQQKDLLSYFTDSFGTVGVAPEHKFTKEREGPHKGAKLENNAAMLFMNSVDRFNRFIHMAPAASTISQLLHDDNFSAALNKATYGEGVKLVDTWLKHAVRGHGDTVNHVAYAMIQRLQHAASVYALGWNIPSSVRQMAGMIHAVSVDSAMMLEMPKALTEAFTGGYRRMATFAREKSAFVRHREIDSVYRSSQSKRTFRSRYGKSMDIDALALGHIKAIDRMSITVAWTALYRTARKRGKNDADAVQFADDWVSKTQEVGGAVYLPDIMRSGFAGAAYRLIAPFTNAINNEANLYFYDNFDPIREKGLRKGAGATAYRFLWNYVVAAMIFGVIRRGRLPEDKKEVAVDLGTYPLAPLLLVGDWAMSVVTDANKRNMLFESGFQTAAATAKAAKRGDWKAVTKNAARTVALLGGALHPKARGLITSQTVRSVEAAYDMAFSDKDVPLEALIYGEYTAEMNKKKEREKVRR